MIFLVVGKRKKKKKGKQTLCSGKKKGGGKGFVPPWKRERGGDSQCPCGIGKKWGEGVRLPKGKGRSLLFRAGKGSYNLGGEEAAIRLVRRKEEGGGRILSNPWVKERRGGNRPREFLLYVL